MEERSEVGEGEESDGFGASGGVGELGMVMFGDHRVNVIEEFGVGWEAICKGVEGGEGCDESFVQGVIGLMREVMLKYCRLLKEGV